MRHFDFWLAAVFTIICVFGAILIMLCGCATRSAFSDRLIKVNNIQEAEVNCRQ